MHLYNKQEIVHFGCYTVLNHKFTQKWKLINLLFYYIRIILLRYFVECV